MTAPRWLTSDEDRAWRGWMAMSSKLRAQLARDLQAECGMSDADFAILVLLSESPAQRMRMTELALALGWSKSRLSHQYSRMVVRGLVAREDCPEDARSTYAVLTPCGRREIEEAAPRHVDSARRHLIDLLDPEQLQALTAITSQVLVHLNEVAGGVPSADVAHLPCPTDDPGTCPTDACPTDACPTDACPTDVDVMLPPCPTTGSPARR
jgi:DNA-binding MarR family transcriptional regulator